MASGECAAERAVWAVCIGRRTEAVEESLGLFTGRIFLWMRADVRGIATEMMLEYSFPTAVNTLRVHFGGKYWIFIL